MTRKTYVKIYLDGIKANYQLANQLAPDSKNIAVIKANAYGHGMIKIAQTLEPLVPAFAVAFIDEAAALRKAGISKPILILQGVQRKQEVEYCCRNDFWIMLQTLEQVECLAKIQTPATIKFWLKLDTGMHRLGLNHEDFLTAYNILSSNAATPGEIILCSHFSCAADVNNSFNQQQLDLFKHSIASIKNHKNLKKSLSNSAALMGFYDSHCEWNRPGIMLYGASPFDSPHENDKKLHTTISFHSEVIKIHHIIAGESVGYGREWIAKRDSKIATIAAGYADGYPFQAKTGTPILIAGQSATLVGRSSMDMITADITDCKGIKLGDDVELWGDNLKPSIVAEHANSIVYELFTSISNRVTRIYQ